MKNIGVFFGGKSVEHDISIITGVLTLNAMKNTKFNPIPIYVSKDGVWYTGQTLFNLDEYKNLQFNKLARVTLTMGSNTLHSVKRKKLKPLYALAGGVNCMHGANGENGSLNGVMNFTNIPMCSPDVLASSVCMDKTLTKVMLKGLNVKTVPSVTISDVSECDSIKEKLNYPLVVKPNQLGSSIGIAKVFDSEGLERACLDAFRFGSNVIIEKAMSNFKEINCACFRDSKGNVIVSQCERPLTKGDLLSFDDKYKQGTREFPALLDGDIECKIRQTTALIYEKLNMEGVIRIDYFVTKKSVYVNEINTVPGSLAYYLFCSSLQEFSSLLQDVIEGSIMRSNQRETFVTKIDTGILNMAGCKSSKRL